MANSLKSSLMILLGTATVLVSGCSAGISRTGDKPYLVAGKSVKSNPKSSSPFQKYDDSFKELISKNWYDLLVGEKLAKYEAGKVVLQFRLNYDGQISDMKVLEKIAGEKEAQICQKAVMAGAPYRPWPDDMSRMVGANYRVIDIAFYYY
jgi:membrane protein involved in colicin uptake